MHIKYRQTPSARASASRQLEGNQRSFINDKVVMVNAQPLLYLPSAQGNRDISDADSLHDEYSMMTKRMIRDTYHSWDSGGRRRALQLILMRVLRAEPPSHSIFPRSVA